MKVIIDNVETYPTTDPTLPAFDNTKLVAINTCPLWGLVRYSLHKTFVGAGRAMALEAGGAAHEVFAAHRLYSFLEHGAEFYNTDQETIRTHFQQHGQRLFPNGRFDEMVGAVDTREDFRTRCQQFALTALYNCGFYDDPSDRRRTVTNIEEMCMAYMDRHNWKDALPVWNADTGFLGIEVPIDITCDIHYHLVSGTGELVARRLLSRFIGKSDGVHWKDKGKDSIRVHENKTASRLGAAWEDAWQTNRQPTGYMIGLSTLLGMPVFEGMVLGSCLPMPTNYALDGLARVVVRRKTWQLHEWFEWFVHTVALHDAHIDDPVTAPQYTHSCNRYFRSCSFIPLCALPIDERREAVAEMEVREWSPLEQEQEGNE